MTRFSLSLLTALALVAPTTFAGAQGMAVGFGGLKQDTSAPVEVTADGLTVDQASGAATFEGNVLVVQGTLRLSAGKVAVSYGGADGGVQRLQATGGVTLATAVEAAEAAEANYDVASGQLVMSGAVLLTQGQATIAGDRLVADLGSGTGRMEGRVKTVFQPAGRGATP